MKNSLDSLTSLSTSCDVSRETYQFIISDGYRWDTFRRTFERKKWFVEGAYIGCRFLDYAREATTRNFFMRESLLCYNLILNMFDKADMTDSFCHAFLTGIEELDWKVPVLNQLSQEELTVLKSITKDYYPSYCTPLYPWISRYIVNKRKQRHRHIQNNELLNVTKKRLESLINFLRDCT